MGLYLYVYDCHCCTQIFINRTNIRCFDAMSNRCLSGIRQLHGVDEQATLIQKVSALGAAVYRTKSFLFAFCEQFENNLNSCWRVEVCFCFIGCFCEIKREVLFISTLYLIVYLFIGR